MKNFHFAINLACLNFLSRSSALRRTDGTTSFPGSLISPPQRREGGEMRDPGNEVADGMDWQLSDRDYICLFLITKKIPRFFSKC